MKDLEERVAAIENRNKKVEQDKAWEVSWTRRISIGVLPVVGFTLSTLALSWVKGLWQRK